MLWSIFMAVYWTWAVAVILSSAHELLARHVLGTPDAMLDFPGVVELYFGVSANKWRGYYYAWLLASWFVLLVVSQIAVCLSPETGRQRQEREARECRRSCEQTCVAECSP